MAALGHSSAWSTATVIIPQKETVSSDKHVRAQVFRNEGVIKGDLVYWAQNVFSGGVVEGDTLGGAQDIDLSGKILGNVRTGGANVNISGQIGKNVTVFAGVVNLTRSSVVNGSVTVYGGKIELDGVIKGNVIAKGRTVTLSGEFFGNVDVNSSGTKRYKYGHKPWEAKLIVLPGTIVHGSLKFRGANADIQNGAKINNFEWDKTDTYQQRRTFAFYTWKFFRFVFTTIAYLLLGFLLLKTFPIIMEKSAEFMQERPWTSAAYGFLTIFSIIAAAVMCIVLLVLSFLMSPAFGIVSTLGAMGLYAILFCAAAIPASIWLGTLIVNNKPVLFRLGTGLVILNGSLFVLKLLTEIPSAGFVFSGISFLVKFCVIVFGSGALVYAVKNGRQRTGNGSTIDQPQQS